MDAIRAQFPSLGGRGDYVFSENAGGSQVLGSVAKEVADYLINTNVQMSGYPLALKAEDRVGAGKKAAAAFCGAASPDDVMFGSSATQLAETLGRMIETTMRRRRQDGVQEEGPTWVEGDELVITEADHETNRGAWLRLASALKLILKTWKLDVFSDSVRTNVGLTLEGLKAQNLITPRTRLVCFTACSNVLGSKLPISAITSFIRSQSQGQAAICVDYVARAPHGALDVIADGVDAGFWSWYKVYGPHVGSMFVSPRITSGPANILTRLNHSFLHTHHGMYPYSASSQQYELIASIPKVLEYLLWANKTMAAVDGSQHNGPAPIDWSSADFDPRKLSAQLHATEGALAAHEAELTTTFLELITSASFIKSGIAMVGTSDVGAASKGDRIATLAFVSTKLSSLQIVTEMWKQDLVGAQQNSLYAPALTKAIGLDADDGVVRVSFVHYNTIEEVHRVVDAIRSALKSLSAWEDA